MQDNGVLSSSRKWIWLPMAIYLPVCILIPFCFFTTWRNWALEAVAMLFGGGGFLLRTLARRVYRRLMQLLPEHAKEIQAYKDDLSIFQWNAMIKPDFVEPLAEGFPRKDELMSELRFAYKLCRIWQIAMWVTLLALALSLCIITAH